MDGTIVATALPSITRDLGGRDTITWIVTGYLLAQIATVPLYGKIGDVHGRKNVYLFAITLFTIASMLCGLAQNQPQLIAARVLQGVGSGAIGPMAMAVLGDLVPPRQLGRWLGYQGAIFAVAGIAGPLAGGFFVDHLSWRWAFYFNVPLAIISVIIVTTQLHVPYRRVEHAIDYVGSALLTGALGAVRPVGHRGRERLRMGLARVGRPACGRRHPRGVVRRAGAARGRAVRPDPPADELGGAGGEPPELHERSAVLLRHLLPPGVPAGGRRHESDRLRAAADPVHAVHRAGDDGGGPAGGTHRPVPHVADRRVACS